MTFSIPKVFIDNQRSWHNVASERSCLENLLMYSISHESRAVFNSIFQNMNYAIHTYSVSQTSPTMSQRFLAAVSNRTDRLGWNDEEDAFQPLGLNISLRPHQMRSLKFCMQRENEPAEILSFLVREDGDDRIFYSPILKIFSYESIQPPRGGLLLDEMGLGKTAVSLALHLANPQPAHWEGGGTLVICPLPSCTSGARRRRP